MPQNRSRFQERSTQIFWTTTTLLLFLLEFVTCSVTAFTSILTIHHSPSTFNHCINPKSKTLSFQSSLSSSTSNDHVTTTDRTTSTATTTTTTMEPSTAPPLPRDLLDTLTLTANAYAAAHGIQVETKVISSNNNNNNNVETTKASTTTTTTAATKTYQMAPMSLLPQAYPRTAFLSAVQLAPHFNRLVHAVSQDADFLVQTLGGIVAQQDLYTGKLLQLYQSIYGTATSTNQWARRADQLGLIRSDYMLHPSQHGDYRIKQVELNTIASSFAGLAHQVAQLHTFLTQRFDQNNAVRTFLTENQKTMQGSTITTTTTTTVQVVDAEPTEAAGVPFNPTLDRLPFAMNLAVRRYQERFLTKDLTCGILFVVQEGETNTVDQRLLEFQLWEVHQIPVVRLSLGQIHHQVQRNDTTGALSVATSATSAMEIALVYYRAGYAPTDYPSGYDGIEWSAREMLEGSRATKCPSLGYHLAGTKKVQQELSRPGRLEGYFPDEPSVVAQMRDAFAGLYSLGDDANEEDRQAVYDIVVNRNHPQYVLKPQREGGGYNFYGEQMLAKLTENVTVTTSSSSSSSSSSPFESTTIALSPTLGEYILMERLFPPQQLAILLRGGNVEATGRTISELGCFGAILVAGRELDDDDKVATVQIPHNEYAGFLLRTKLANVDEGGVAAGFATLSSPYLF
jgi:glutathione synthase